MAENYINYYIERGTTTMKVILKQDVKLSLIHISEPTRP